jgi:hypothetical protein
MPVGGPTDRLGAGDSGLTATCIPLDRFGVVLGWVELGGNLSGWEAIVLPTRDSKKSPFFFRWSAAVPPGGFLRTGDEGDAS